MNELKLNALYMNKVDYMKKSTLFISFLHNLNNYDKIKNKNDLIGQYYIFFIKLFLKKRMGTFK